MFKRKGRKDAKELFGLRVFAPFAFNDDIAAM